MSKMRSLRIILPVLAAILIAAGSCTTGACFEETTAYAKASMYLSSTRKLTAPDSLSLYGPGMDTSMFYSSQKNISRAMLPLDDSKDSCRLVMKINNVRDTLTIWYSSHPHLISKECGYTYYHTIDSLHFTKNSIDSLSLIKSTITTVLEENLRIYY
jgi:hypothetical protein